MVGDFVTLSDVAVLAQVEDESAQSGSGHQDFQRLRLPSLFPLLLDGLHDGSVACGPLLAAGLCPIAIELANGAPRLVNIRVLRDADPLTRHGGLGLRGSGGNRAERLQTRLSNGARQDGVGLYGLVDAFERVQKVERRRRQQLPVGLGEGVKGLPTEVGDVEMGDFGILTEGMFLSMRALFLIRYTVVLLIPSHKLSSQYHIFRPLGLKM